MTTRNSFIPILVLTCGILAGMHTPALSHPDRGWFATKGEDESLGEEAETGTITTTDEIAVDTEVALAALPTASVAAKPARAPEVFCCPRGSAWSLLLCLSLIITLALLPWTSSRREQKMSPLDSPGDV